MLMAVSFVLMPIKNVAFIPGLLFWAGLAVGAALQIVLGCRRRAFFASYGVNRRKMQKPRNGLLTFGSSRGAVIVDICMIVSFLATIVAFIITEGYGLVCYVLITTTLTAFCLHCILNGRIYFHVKNQLKVRQVLEQKKVDTKDKGEGKK